MSRSRFDHVPAGAQLLSSFSRIQVWGFNFSLSPLPDTLNRFRTLVAIAAIWAILRDSPQNLFYRVTNLTRGSKNFSSYLALFWAAQPGVLRLD